MKSHHGRDRRAPRTTSPSTPGTLRIRPAFDASMPIRNSYERVPPELLEMPPKGFVPSSSLGLVADRAPVCSDKECATLDRAQSHCLSVSYTHLRAHETRH